MNTELLKKSLILLLFVGVLWSCSKDDEVLSQEDALMAEVPSGEIVPVELREETLVGFNSSTGRMANESQIWWNHVILQLTYDCPEFYDENANETLNDTGYIIAFKPDGFIYYKTSPDGPEFQHHAWEWNDDMSGIILNGQATFYFNELNESNVVYYSMQGEENCYVLTWEQYTMD